MEIKSLLKNTWVGVVKKSVLPLCSQYSKIGCISRTLINGVNCFLDAYTNSGKLKFTSIIFGWSWSKIGLAF